MTTKPSSKSTCTIKKSTQIMCMPRDMARGSISPMLAIITLMLLHNLLQGKVRRKAFHSFCATTCSATCCRYYSYQNKNDLICSAASSVDVKLLVVRPCLPRSFGRIATEIGIATVLGRALALPGGLYRA